MYSDLNKAGSRPDEADISTFSCCRQVFVFSDCTVEDASTEHDKDDTALKYSFLYLKTKCLWYLVNPQRKS